MKFLFWLLALFGIAAAVALGAQLNAGYVLLVLPPWRVEVSLNLLLLVLVLVFFGFHLLLRGAASIANLPAQVAAYKARVAREKSFSTFEDAFRLLFEGRYGQALKKAQASFEGGGAPGLSALVAARAAQRMRQPEAQDRWLTEATRIDPQIESARYMLEAEMHLDARRYDDAIAAVNQLHKKARRHIAALRLELRARQGAGHWEDVLKLARQLEKRDALAPEVARELITQAHLKAVERRQSDTKALLGYMRDIPTKEMRSRIGVAAVKALLALDAAEEAAHVIETCLAQDWNGELVRLYGYCADGRPSARLAEAEKWLLQHPEDAGLLLTLGRLCLAQRLWGKAQSYFEASLSIQGGRDAHLELARLFERLEQPEKAAKHFRRAAEGRGGPDEGKR